MAFEDYWDIRGSGCLAKLAMQKGEVRMYAVWLKHVMDRVYTPSGDFKCFPIVLLETLGEHLADTWTCYHIRKRRNKEKDQHDVHSDVHTISDADRYVELKNTHALPEPACEYFAEEYTQ